MIPLKIETLLAGRVVEQNRVEYKVGVKANPKILHELKKNGSREPEFEMDEDRTYLNTIIHIRDGFKKSFKVSDKMSDKMSDKEKMFYGFLLHVFETPNYVTTKFLCKI